jgi:hypothetical protein
MTAHAPTNDNHRQAIQRWDNEGGASSSRERSRLRRCPPHRELTSALYYLNLRTSGGFIEDPEGETFADNASVRRVARTRARRLIVKGDHNGENRRDWQFEITGRENQHVLTVAFLETLNPKKLRP